MQEDQLEVVPSSAVAVQWEERQEEGLFRYDVSACETKVRERVLTPLLCHRAGVASSCCA